MPNVRTTCPNCDIVTVRAMEVTVRQRELPERSEAVFVCPDCADVVIHPLNERMVPVLIGAGCPVEDPAVAAARLSHPSVGFELTDAEIDRFVARLDDSDWFDELIS